MNRLKIAKNWFRHPVLNCMFIGVLTAALLAIFQYLGVFQSLELLAYDQLLLKRPSTAIDNRIVLIGETEADIRRFGHPLSDQIFADALKALEKAGARVIGVDKYRDLPTPPGTEALKTVLQEHGNIIWIFFSGSSKTEYVPPPAALANNPERIGFNDLIEDPDGEVRRGLLFLDVGNTSYPAFPLLLALHYLAGEHIGAESDADGNLSLNGTSLPRIDAQFGAYSRIDVGGYQIMLDYPGLPQSFPIYTLSELLDGKIADAILHDKIVLLGATAPSLNDYLMLPNEVRRSGVEHHAYSTSQILNSAIQKKPPLRAWSEPIEFVWLLLWCLIGALTGLRKSGKLPQLLILIILEPLLLIGCSHLLLNQGWWLPLIAPFTGWFSALAFSELYFMSLDRAERRQLMQLFSRHVSPEVATRLWESREQFFNEGGIRPDTLTATVLFTDLSNYTTIAEHMEPMVLMNWLNQYMEEMSLIITAHGGMIKQYIGDAIMAIFGAPVKRDTDDEIAHDAQQAVLCALQFGLRLRELNQQWQAQGLPTVTMRTGIHTGSLVAGCLGGATRMEYTVIGDTVNIASRFESFDKTIATPTEQQPCRILIGERTYNYVRHLCETEEVGKCQLKGKDQQLNIYQVLRLSA